MDIEALLKDLESDDTERQTPAATALRTFAPDMVRPLHDYWVKQRQIDRHPPPSPVAMLFASVGLLFLGALFLAPISEKLVVILALLLLSLFGWSAVAKPQQRYKEGQATRKRRKYLAA